MVDTNQNVCESSQMIMLQNRLQIFSKQGANLGSVQKQWSGFVKECCTVADNFGITCVFKK